MEPPIGFEPMPDAYKASACLLSYRGEVSPARLERALPTSSRWCLLPLGYEDMEPPSGVEPDHPPYEGGAAASARRQVRRRR